MQQPLIKTLNEKWPDSKWRIMFHGTAGSFAEFSESDSIGRGGDLNSSLGVHLAEFPEPAGEYALAAGDDLQGNGNPQVLIVALRARNAHMESDYHRFFGLTDDGDPDPSFGKTGFSRWRQELLTGGFDVVDYEDGEGCITVALESSDLLIIGRMSPDEAFEVDQSIRDLSDPFDPIQRLGAIVQAGIEIRVPETPGHQPPAAPRTSSKALNPLAPRC